MSDELKQRSNEFLLKLIDDLQKVEAGIAEQAPAIVGEVVTWGRLSSTLLVVSSFAILCLGIWAMSKMLEYGERALKDEAKTMAERLKEKETACNVGVFLGVLGIFVFLLMFSCNIGPFLKSWSTPRLYAVECLLEAVRR